MPFAPSDISGLKIWLKADAGAGSSDNDPVGTWTDQSGTSHDFTQATSGKKPLYKTNIRNGLPVVRFDGSDDELSGGDLSAVFTTGGSVFAAMNAATNGSQKILGLETKNNDGWWSFAADGYWATFRSSRLSATGTFPTTGWHVYSLTADNGSNYKVWTDGVSAISSGAFTFDGGNAHLIGKQTTNNQWLAFDYGELIVYDTALGTTDRQSVEAYLNARWGTVANGTGTPSQVAGVGAVPAATTTGRGIALPSQTAGIGAVPAPTASGNFTANPVRVAGVGAVPAPTAFGAINATATAGIAAGIGRVPHPHAKGQGTGGGGGSADGSTDFWNIKALE